MPTIVTCSECREREDADRLTRKYRLAMIELGMCFTCLHWAEKVRIRDEATVARIGGMHYQIEPETASPHDRGFSGRRFVIRFHDGRQVTTSNLWHQGEIPAHFRARLPDNAAWVER